MKQVAVISGKGGTGKTSVCASLARLARPVVSADCDVDAANLALLQLGPDEIHEPYYHGRRVSVDLRRCIGCGACEAICRFDAIRLGDTGLVFSDPFACSGCGACVQVCPEKVLGMHGNIVGIWTARPAGDGPLVHAVLGVAQENTGALVAKVRERALKVAKEKGIDLILIDGPPGIGRPVQIAIQGADLILVVTEPSTSGEHDLARVLDLSREMKIPAMVLVNKADLEPEVCARVEQKAVAAGAEVVGRLPFDPGVPRALALGKLPLAVPRMAEPLNEVWQAIKRRLA
jgi:MinD superfamily P-loop ATPase